MDPDEYLRLNVYRSDGRWMLAIRILRAGRPYGRSLGKPRIVSLTKDSASASTAFRLAAEELTRIAEGQQALEEARQRYGTP